MLDEIFLISLFTAILYGLYWFFAPLIHATTQQQRHPLSHNHTYVDVRPELMNKGGRFAQYPFSTIFSTPNLHLSVIIPTSDNAQLLEATLANVINTLMQLFQENRTLSSEIIVVEDGNDTNITPLVINYAQQYTSEFIRLLKLPYAMGTGACVQHGALHARGKNIAVLDVSSGNFVDFSSSYTPMQQKLDQEVTNTGNTAAVVIASRGAYHYEWESKLKKMKENHNQLPGLEQLKKNILYTLNHTILGLPNVINDTCCGLKLYTRDAVTKIMNNQHLQRENYDLEILYLANIQRIPIYSIDITLIDPPTVEKSILKPSMAYMRDAVITRLLHLLGVWRIRPASWHTQFAVFDSIQQTDDNNTGNTTQLFYY